MFVVIVVWKAFAPKILSTSFIVSFMPLPIVPKNNWCNISCVHAAAMFKGTYFKFPFILVPCH